MEMKNWFCILKIKITNGIQKMILKNKKIVKYSAAVGYSIYRTNKDFEQVFKEADSKMYQDKKNMKM